MRRDTQFTSELLAGEPAVTSLCQTSCLNIIPVAVLETLQNRMSGDGDAPPFSPLPPDPLEPALGWPVL